MIKAAFAQQPLELDPRYPGQGDIGADSGWDGGYFVLDEDPLA
jgi:hypothetical protein